MDNQAANIGHFDHSFTCALEQHSASAVPKRERQAALKPDMIAKFGDDARMGEMICMMEKFKLDEEIGTNLGDMKRRTILEVRYETLEKLVWDHSVCCVKVRTRKLLFGFSLFSPLVSNKKTSHPFGKRSLTVTACLFALHGRVCFLHLHRSRSRPSGQSRRTACH